MLNVGINGFGRIGRLILRALLEKNEKEINVLAINDLGNLKQNIHLLKYDSTHGKLAHELDFDGDNVYINNNKVKFYSKKLPEEIPWDSHQIDIVLECTGIFTKAEEAKNILAVQ